ncbi:MAG: DUF484 family protein [Oceanospirillaceae bacterium]|jgi:hypothetical protein|nr:DUF484 family protein [Oceanospirillaceae bacterium]MBT4442444.1 DUF484 family protein [Oceanospirillaceae bacterium]MBT6076831.1 DUF484 family protein [Oceanospirillaceae bacterium]MBT7330167.1 DUF484 family protein [Oceanospirillaceae bacterium]
MSQLEKQDVADYLRQNPDFFNQYPELLADLELSHNCGQATSLIERQTQVMRHKLQDYATKMSDILGTARRNDVQFEKTKRLVIELASATSLNALTEALKQSFINEFHADAAHLALFSKVDASDNHPDLSDAQGDAQIMALADKNWAYCQAFTEPELQQLFQHSSTLKSCAIVPLYLGDTPLGVLIIASNTQDHYNQQLDTLFLNHVAAVTGRCLGRLT